HPVTVLVFDVDRRDGRVVQRFKQPGLGGGVVAHLAVVIEVVASEVGERRPGEADPGDALLVQGVARHLYRAGAAPLVAHGRQELGDVARSRRRHTGFAPAAAVVYFHRPDEPAPGAGLAEQVAEQISGRRLAV